MANKVIVAGGGASGLAAAIAAAENGAAVTVLEHKDRVGKKILMTGNGKCNLTNMQDVHTCQVWRRQHEGIFSAAWLIYERKAGWRGVSGIGASLYCAGCATECM